MTKRRRHLVIALVACTSSGLVGCASSSSPAPNQGYRTILGAAVAAVLTTGASPVQHPETVFVSWPARFMPDSQLIFEDVRPLAPHIGYGPLNARPVAASRVGTMWLELEVTDAAPGDDITDLRFVTWCGETCGTYGSVRVRRLGTTYRVDRIRVRGRS